jgi:hypothetical protein
VEVLVLFAGHRKIEVHCRARLPGNPQSEKLLGVEWEAIGRSRDIKARVKTFLEKRISNQKEKVKGKNKREFG